MITRNKRLIGIVVTVTLLLLIPLIAMQLTDEVNWSSLDFVIAGVLLLSTGLLCELVIRKIKNARYRIAICSAVGSTRSYLDRTCCRHLRNTLRRIVENKL